MQTHSPDRRRAAFCPQAGKSLAGQVIQDPLDHAQRHSGFASFRWRGKSQSLHCLRWRVFDTRDDLNRSSALRAGFDINLENPLEALRPLHRRALLGWCAVFGLGGLCGLRTPAPAGRCDPGPEGAIRRKHTRDGFALLLLALRARRAVALACAVEAGQVQSRRRDEHRGLPECGLPEARSALAKPARACRQPGDEIQRLEDYMRSAVGRWVRFARSARSALRETISASRHGTGFSVCSRPHRVPSGTGAFLTREDGRCIGTAAQACRAGRL